MALINFLTDISQKGEKNPSSFPAAPAAQDKGAPAQVQPAPIEPQKPMLKIPSDKPAQAQKPMGSPANQGGGMEEFDVNLIPMGQRVEVDGNVIWFKAVLVLVIAWLVVEGVNIYAKRIVKRQENIEINAQKEVSELGKEAEKELDKSRKIKVFSKRLLVLSALLDKHIYWTPFLDILEKRTLPQVYYTNMAADASGVITLQGAAKDLVTAAQQIVSLRSDENVESVEISGLSLKKARVSVSRNLFAEKVVSITFSFNIKLKEGILSKPLAIK